jgi:KAP family P-loop domain
VESLEKWEGDELNRTQEGVFLYNYLINRYETDTNEEFESIVLNIDASWGLGKTFFLSHLEKDIKAKGHPVVSFNAWDNDFQDNPLIAFISEIEDQLKPYLASTAKAQKLYKSTFKTGARLLRNSIPLLSAILLKQFTGLNMDRIQKIFNGDEEFDITLLWGRDSDQQEHKEERGESENDKIIQSFVSLLSMYGKESLEKYIAQKKDIKDFRDNFLSLVNSIGSNKKKINLPVFIFIDELDRCRPTYAIELLEKIKHLFSIKGVYFILATDTKQLCHSIKVIYGNDFDSSRYLNRFFNQTYEFQKSDYNTYAKYLFNRYNMLEKAPFLFSPFEPCEFLETGDPIVEIFAVFSQYFRLTLRDQEQIISHLYTICLSWSKNNESLHSPFIIFLLMLRHISKEQFELFQKENYHLGNCVTNYPDFYSRLNGKAEMTQKISQTQKKHVYSVPVIINAYRGFISSTYKGIIDQATQSRDNKFIDNIREDCINTINNRKRAFNNKDRDCLNFKSYIEIVKQVGHLIKDKKFENISE